MRCAVLRIEGMTCGACSSAVERALAAEAGVLEASVSCVTHVAQVRYDADKASAAMLAEAVEDIGFGAEVAEDALEGEAAAGPPAAEACELRIHGMTCAQCSGTVERHLKGVAGMTKVTVNLILHKAFAVYDPVQLTPSQIVEEIEAVGFDADVVCVAGASSAGGKATLDVQLRRLDSSDAGMDVLRIQDFALSLPGVLECYTTVQGHERLSYDPHAIGARSLLARLQGHCAGAWELEPVSANGAEEQLMSHVEELKRIRGTMFVGAPVTSAVIVITLVLPAFGYYPLNVKVCHTVDWQAIIVWLLATIAQFFVGCRFHRAALKALRRKSPNMDVLVSVSTNIAYFYSSLLLLVCLIMPESGDSHELIYAAVHFLTMGPILITVVLLGKLLESVAKLSALRAMTDLSSTQNCLAVLCGPDNEDTIPAQLAEVGDILRVYPGSKIPVDGVLVSDSGVYVDASLLTGESTPAAKQPGDLLIGGTTCVSGGCLMRATQVGAETTLGQMQKLIQDAQASKAEIQRVADRVARIFVPSVLVLSFATFASWFFLVFFWGVHIPHAMHTAHGVSDVGQLPSGELESVLKLLFAMKFSMAVLMIACPCAMGLATPMAVMVATGVAAKHGCLVKSAAALESSAWLRAVVIDKTGTLTEGVPVIQAAACVVGHFDSLLDAWSSVYDRRPRQGVPAGGSVEIEPLDGGHVPESIQACFWWLLGVLESASDHPIAGCIQEEVKKISNLPPLEAPKNFECLSGRGIRCQVDELGGTSASIGNLRFLEETPAVRLDVDGSAALRAWVAKLQHKGHTVVILQAGGLPLGAAALSDPIRPEAAEVVEFLRRRLGLEVVLCTGDNTATAQAIAAQVGIQQVVAEALPSTKSDCVRSMQGLGRGGKVCFIGDGINDSPALARADVGVAIGAGAQVAIEAADVILVGSDLRACVNFLSLSRVTFRTITLNFFWAFCFNFICLPVAAGVFYPHAHIPPLVAGIGMACSSILVVGTSLLLRLFRPPAPLEGMDCKASKSADLGVKKAKDEETARLLASPASLPQLLGRAEP